ncbi:zinc finger domain-containing protein, partial [Anaerotruncus rubiinfantis]
DRTDRDRLFSCVRQVLREMTEAGGRDTERGLFGEPGCYHTKMSAKNYPGFCPVCGAPVVRKAFLGGNVYFCPKCQPVQK